jgi:hypothetical protein
MNDKFEGGCLCGAIRFIATGNPKGVFWCHCQSCRRHSGAPVSVFIAFERNAYTVTKGQITRFKSSPGTNETHFHVGTFDDAGRFEPSKHFFRDEQLPWLHLT